MSLLETMSNIAWNPEELVSLVNQSLYQTDLQKFALEKLSSLDLSKEFWQTVQEQVTTSHPLGRLAQKKIAS